LSLDPAALATAISADPERTRAVLAGATQSLIDLATEFETQLASATVSLGKPDAAWRHGSLAD
jgi:flagellar capping protein FliD